MKHIQLEFPGFRELAVEEQQQVTGGNTGLLFGILTGLNIVYNFGKAVGAELYYATH